ncbi:MAG: hypothetical protein V8S93_01930 [Lachnospiraceae bacterium]
MIRKGGGGDDDQSGETADGTGIRPRTTYQFTLEQIEAMKRQAVLDAKEKSERGDGEGSTEHIQERMGSETGNVRRE